MEVNNLAAENTNSPNTIKYSIWDTRTNKSNPGMTLKEVESVKETILEAKNQAKPE